MSNLQPPWDQYVALQTKLKDSTTVDDTSWGREAALNRILASNGVAPADEIERVARSESRRERYRASLRRQDLSSHVYLVDGEAVLQARQQLRIVKAAVSDQEWALLSDVAEGWSYGEIAAAAGATAGALRVRMRRLRQRVNALAA